MLAKRLIHGLSLSMDSEEAMINKLKVHLELHSRKPMRVTLKVLILFHCTCSKPAATSLRANCIECTQTWAWVPTSTTSSTTLSRRRTQWWTWVSAFRSTFYRWATGTCTYARPHFRGGFSVQSLTLCSWLSGRSVASHPCPLLHFCHPSRAGEECADGEHGSIAFHMSKEHTASWTYVFLCFFAVRVVL